MTINTSTNTVTVLGDGATTQFGFGFIGVAAAYMSVIFTDASGNETVLTQGAGSSQYQIVLNEPVEGALWGVGGTVTYDPGSPIAVGTSLTIFRTLPLTQAISLQNLVSLATLGNGAETGLDTLEMQLQQVVELQGRAIVAPIVDPSTIDLTLPAAAQRANTGLAFDSQGNVIAGTTPATGIISSAMQPVVDAASLALGRTAFGLGAMAVEGIGAGLQDDGSGNARVFFNTVGDAANQSVNKTFHLTQRIASASSLSVPLVYTLAQTTSLFNGFGFWIFALAGNAELTPNAADNFDGLASGVSVAVPQGSWAWVTTNGAGVWHIEYNGENMALQAAVSGNNLTITLNATSIRFRDTTLTAGDPIWQNIPAALSITVPNGATLGTSNNVPARVYVFAALNGGSPILGVALASTATEIFPLATWEARATSSTILNTSSDSAGVLYTPSAVTNDAVRLLGYVDFSSGQATAGIWATSPSKVQLMGPGVPKPGQIIQTVVGTGSTQAITPSSSLNLVRVSFSGALVLGTSGGTVTRQLVRGATPVGLSLGMQSGAASADAFVVACPLLALDAPGSSASVTYGTTGGGSFNSEIFILDEIVG